MSDETTSPKEREQGLNYCNAPPPWTWRDSLRYRFFPASRVPQWPDAPAEWNGSVFTEVDVHLSWLDRLRVLVSGRLRVESRMTCEHEVGRNIANSGSYVLPPKFLDYKRD